MAHQKGFFASFLGRIWQINTDWILCVAESEIFQELHEDQISVNKWLVVWMLVLLSCSDARLTILHQMLLDY